MKHILTTEYEEKLNRFRKNARVSTAATTLRETRSSGDFRNATFSPKFSFSDSTSKKSPFSIHINKMNKKLFFDLRETLKRNEKEEWIKLKNQNESNLSQNFKFDERKFLQRYAILEESNKKDNLNIMAKLINFKSKFSECLRQKELEKAIDYLISIMEISLAQNDLKLLAITIKNIADTYLMFGELKNAIFANSQLKLFCEITGMNHYKMDCYKNLAKCCKKLGKMDKSLIFLKKALQYCWFYDEYDVELDLYEDIGLIYYHIGNLEKAKYYHERSLSNELESKDSSIRKLAKINIENLLKLSNSAAIINSIFFDRFPSLPFDYAKQSDNLKKKENNLTILSNKNRLTSDLKEYIQIHNILQTDEFIFEIGSPIHKKTQNKEEILKSQNFNSKNKPSKKMFKKHQRTKTEASYGLGNSIFKSSFINEIFESKNIHRETQPKIPQISSEMKKLSLKEKIEFRLKLGKYLEKNELLTDMKTLKKSKQTQENLNKKILINHLSPRRNMEQYQYSCNVLNSQPNQFFDKIISDQYYKL